MNEHGGFRFEDHEIPVCVIDVVLVVKDGEGYVLRDRDGGWVGATYQATVQKEYGGLEKWVKQQVPRYVNELRNKERYLMEKFVDIQKQLELLDRSS